MNSLEFIILSLFILLFYVLESYKHLNIKNLIISLIFFVLNISFFIIVNIFYDNNLSYYFTLVFIIITTFILLHINKNRVSIIFYLLFILTYILLLYLGISINKYLDYLSIISVIILILIESNQKLIRKSYEQSSMEYQNKIIEKQVDEVQNIYNTMRGWRHDYHNHLQTLKAHLSMKNYELANLYLTELEKDLDSINYLVESGNVNLDAILNSKLSYANTKEININYKATVPNILTLKDIDLCVLIGNLIDNAVEACEKIKNSDKFIRLYIGIFKEQLYISITNSTNEFIRKLDDEYFTNKRGNHGHGLKRINKIVEKYNGYINRKNEPGVFVTEILLPL